MAKKTKLSSAALAENMASLKAKMTSMQMEYDEMAAELLTRMKGEGMSQLGIFYRSLRQTLKVTDINAAMVWAQDKNVLKIDTAKAMKLIKREFEVPAFFAVKEVEYLRTKTQQEEE